MSDEPAIVEVLRALDTLLTRFGDRWYVFGAQAVLVWGRPRLTGDVDVTAFLDPDDPAALAAAMEAAGFEVLVRDTLFEDPGTLRIDRKPNDHLAFGIGAHFCLGANLARAEIRIVFRELLRRLPDIRVAPGEGPVRVPSPLVAAIASLPVVFTPERGHPDLASAR